MTLTFQEAKLGPMKIFYLEYIGEYHKIGQTFGRVCNDINHYFKFARPFGLYYDPPSHLVDPKQARAIVGVILNNGENPSKEEEFAKAYIQYKKAELPLVEAIVTKFPYRNRLTFLMFGKVYGEISKYIKRKYEKQSLGQLGGIMEIYYINKSNNFIEFYWIHGPNVEKYLLATAAKPLYKEDHQE